MEGGCAGRWLQLREPLALPPRGVECVHSPALLSPTRVALAIALLFVIRYYCSLRHSQKLHLLATVVHSLL